MGQISTVPTFPPSSVVKRTNELGFGTGPWEKSELAKMWGENVASKFVAEARASGWLVSPFRGQFYVPAAQDLMTVGWLPNFERQEFIISRTLAACGVRSWCLSAWARGCGLEFPQPLFVTDLTPRPENPISSGKGFLPASTTIQASREISRQVAQRLSQIPFLDNVIVVPRLPQASPFGVASVTRLGVAPKKPVAEDVLFTLESDILGTPTRPPELRAREISYILSAPISDDAWVVALLATLGLPRMAEIIPDLVRSAVMREQAAKSKEPTDYFEGGRLVGYENRLSSAPPREPGYFESQDFLRRLENKAGALGQPEPNDRWSQIVCSQQFAYLLVPPALWQEIQATKSSERFTWLDDLRESMRVIEEPSRAQSRKAE